MTTVSDFGSLEVKRLRIDEEIAGARYGTEIMDTDLVFKVGDNSNPHQSIRFSVHDGVEYKEAFYIDSNGFAVSDLKMSGPSSGLIAMDELVKLGEIRVQHHTNHANVRSGEIVFSVNIGDSDSHLIDVMSLTPEAVYTSNDVVVEGVLSCAAVSSATLAVRGHELRTDVAAFRHPLAKNEVTVSKDNNGQLRLYGPLESTHAHVDTLECDVLSAGAAALAGCSVARLDLRGWSVSEADSDLHLKGAGRVCVSSLGADSVVAARAEAATADLHHLEAGTAVAGALEAGMISASQLHVQAVATGGAGLLMDVGGLHFSGPGPGETTTLRVESAAMAIDDGSEVYLSGRTLRAAGAVCSDGRMSLSGLECPGVDAGRVAARSVESERLHCDSLLAGRLSCGAVLCDRMHAGACAISKHELRVMDSLAVSADGVRASDVLAEGLKATTLEAGSAGCGRMATEALSAAGLEAQRARIGTLQAETVSSSGLQAARVEAANSVHIDTAALTCERGDLVCSHGIRAPGLSVGEMATDALVMRDRRNDHSLPLTWESHVLNVPCPIQCDALSCSEGIAAAALVCPQFNAVRELAGTDITLSAHTLNLGPGVTISAPPPASATASPAPPPAVSIQADDVALLITHGRRGGTFAIAAAEGATALRSSRPLEVRAPSVNLPATSCSALEAPTLKASRVEVAEECILPDLVHVHTLRGGAIEAGRLSAPAVACDAATLGQLDCGRISCPELLSADGGGALRLTPQGLSWSTSQDRVRFSLASGAGSRFEIRDTGAEFRLDCSSSLTLGRGLSCQGLRAPRVDTLGLQSPTGTVEVASHLEVKGACSVGGVLASRGVLAESVDSGLGRFGRVQSGTLEAAAVTFRTPGGGTLLRADEDTLLLGAAPSAREGAATARLAVHARAFCEGIRVTADEAASIVLETGNQQARVLALRTPDAAGGSDEWAIGVPNHPPDLENTAGLYHNERPYLRCIPAREVVSVDVPLVAPRLSVQSIEVGLVAGREGRLALSCTSLEAPGALLSDGGASFRQPASFDAGISLNQTTISSLAPPRHDGDATNRAYVESRLEEWFTEDRLFYSHIYWVPPDQRDLRAFFIGLTPQGGATGGEDPQRVTFDFGAGLHQGHGIRFVGGGGGPGGGSGGVLMEILPEGQTSIHTPLNLAGALRLPNHTVASSESGLLISGGDVTISGGDVTMPRRLGVGTAASHALHVVSDTDDDCAVFASSNTRSRVTVEATGALADQAMTSHRVGSRLISSGYLHSSDAYVVASSTDLAQNTHLVVSAADSSLRTAGDITVSKPSGSFRIEEDGAATFSADKNGLRCQNFDIAFDSFSVDHRLGGLSILNLSADGASINGTATVSESVRIKGTSLFESELGDLHSSSRISAPDITTGTVSLKDKVGFNIYEDGSDLLRFREGGDSFLMNFDKSDARLDFSFSTLANEQGPGALFASDFPLMSLKKASVGINSNSTRAQLAVASEDRPQLSLENPTGAYADLFVSDAGELNATSSNRKYTFHGDVAADRVSTDYVYVGPQRHWRLGVSQEGSLVIQHYTEGGTYVTKQEILAF